MFNPERWSWRSLLAAGILIYAVAAFFSEGYYHLDEHFQLLEFANYKLGATPAADLPWEFGAQIRPALQPLIAVGAIKLLRAAGFDNPFTAAFVLRLFGGMLLLAAVTGVARRFSPGVAASSGKRLLAAAILLWFMPYLAVRFSSENWSAIAFLFGVALLPDPDAGEQGRVRGFMTMGFLLGLSFVLRFQMGFALVGVAAWLVTQRQLRWRDAIAIASGGIGGVLVGVVADRSFYGHLVFTPWRYFAANILQGKAAEFGIAPPWFYLPAFVVAALPPISIVLLLLAVLGAWKNPRHLFTWVVVAFVVGHSLVGHKELRFLFPMAVPFLWLVVAGWQARRADAVAPTGRRGIWWAIAAMNALALVWICTRPAQQFIPAWRYLYEQAQTRHVIVFAEQRSPYDMGQLKPHFYSAPNLAVEIVPSFDAMGDSGAIAPRVGDLLLQRHLAAEPFRPGYHLERVFRGYPAWLLGVNVADWERRTEIWSIYRVSGVPDHSHEDVLQSVSGSPEPER